MIIWDIDGTILHTWQCIRPHDIAVDSSGDRLVVASESNLVLYSLGTKEEIGRIGDTANITSLSLSDNGHNVLVNLESGQIHLWNLETNTLLHHYSGHQQHRFIIRSCFGLPDQSIILSGSEDSKLYIWHRDRERLVEVVSGHGATISCVAWNRNTSGMFASASDDKIVCIWERRIT